MLEKNGCECQCGNAEAYRLHIEGRKPIDLAKTQKSEAPADGYHKQADDREDFFFAFFLVIEMHFIIPFAAPQNL